MRVIQAQSAGFCYGVERAVRMAEEAAAAGGCVMLGSILHNDSVVRRLEALGARQVQSAEEVQPGETVLIRAHGEPVETYRTLEARGAWVLDATCPHVLRIHRLVERAEQEGRTPLIIGEDHHPEVIAAASRSSRRGTGLPALAPFSSAWFISRSSAKASVCWLAPAGGAGGGFSPSHNSNRWISCPWAKSCSARRQASCALALAGFSTRSNTNKIRITVDLSNICGTPCATVWARVRWPRPIL